MRKFIIGSVVLTAGLFVGCNSGGGGECCGATTRGNLAGLGAESLPPKGPAALFDGNWTIEKKSDSSSAGTLSSLGNTEQSSDASSRSTEVINFVFNCSDSYNQDDANISISNCSWNFTNTTADCLDKNSSVGNIVNVKYSCNDVVLDGNMTIILTVKDDLNQTAESNATLNINKKDDGSISITAVN